MTDSNERLDQTENNVLAYEVSDEALEATADAGLEVGNYTLAACTGLNVCPA